MKASCVLLLLSLQAPRSLTAALLHARGSAPLTVLRYRVSGCTSSSERRSRPSAAVAHGVPRSCRPLPRGWCSWRRIRARQKSPAGAPAYGFFCCLARGPGLWGLCLTRAVPGTSGTSIWQCNRASLAPPPGQASPPDLAQNAHGSARLQQLPHGPARRNRPSSSWRAISRCATHLAMSGGRGQRRGRPGQALRLTLGRLRSSIPGWCVFSNSSCLM